MDIIDSDQDSDLEIKENPGPPAEKLAAAAGSCQLNNLFEMLEEAEREHHDALVELKETVGPQKPQFRLLRGGACLLKTSPGKA